MTEYRCSAAYRRTISRSRRCLPLVCAGMLAMLLPGPGIAQRDNLVPAPTPTVISLQEAVSIATQSRPGRVVRAVTVDEGGGRITHEVRILLNEGGRVVTVRVDAQTGRVH
jgi:uncharacterized membrane protein YkoI